MKISNQVKHFIHYPDNQMQNQYTKLYNVVTMDFGTMEIVIEKVKKEGTKRTFYKTTHNGENICKTLRARLYDAKNAARKYHKLKTA